MAYADQVFVENCRDILKNGSWDTAGEVRPRWEDGSPAHTIKRFSLVNITNVFLFILLNLTIFG